MSQPGDGGDSYPVIRAQGRRKSRFPAQTGVLDGASFDYFVNGVNYKISFNDLLPALGATGTLSQLGLAGSTPILDPQGSDNRIRNARGVVGVSTSVNAAQELEIRTNLQTGSAQGVQTLINPTTAPAFRSIRGGSGINVAAAGDLITISAGDTPVASNTIVVNTLADLPDPVAGVITLEASTVYLFASLVDVGANRFVGQDETAVTGSSVFATGIISSTTGTLFTVSGDGPAFEISDISIDAPNAQLIDMSSTTPQLGALIVARSRFVNIDSIGSVSNLRVVYFTEAVFDGISTNGLQFAGAFTLINLDSLLATISAGTLVDLGTCTSLNINIENGNVGSLDPSVVIVDGLPNSGNLPVGAQGTVRAMNIIGPFTSTGNILPTDLRWYFFANSSVSNSTNSGEVSMAANATVTTIAAANTPVKIAGTWTVERESRFQGDTTGRLTYVGETPSVTVDVTATVSALKQGGGTDTYIFYVALNDVVLARSAIQMSGDGTTTIPVPIVANLDMVPNDYVEVWVEGDGTTDDMLVTYANLTVAGDA